MFKPLAAFLRARIGWREARFWSKVDKSGGPDACWPWTGFINKVTGYGQVSFRLLRSNPMGAHQVAYFLTHGALNPRLVVMHTCDNKVCCNPRHLCEDTHKANTQDAIDKGRRKKLTTEERRAAKAKYSRERYASDPEWRERQKSIQRVYRAKRAQRRQLEV